ncbi:glycosyl hydrolase [Microlunatus soli]|uniref:Glycosyl hydrolase family 26 n=1 Tax=Microlunatus soli TaxID=630515 RepID=A0A1H1TUX2_9ACTN|nr:glycosyl hydrolase [Microlunatus soli]SDS63944.1 Glycosyl hydrolase family 26 [Microlunatus soli]
MRFSTKFTAAAAVLTLALAGPSVTAHAAPDDASPGWLSGASGPQAADGSFGSWRGAETEIAGTWVNSPELYTLQPGGELGAWDKPVDVGISPPDWQGWQAEAAGAHDDFYRQAFATMKKLRDGKGTTYVRPWYEFNGNWMPYAVGGGDTAAFKQAWIRVATIARQEFPGVQLVYCASAANGSDVYSAFPGKEYVDVGGVDFYNNYPFVTSQAGFDAKADNAAGAYSLNDLAQFYAQQGLPVAINEWSNQGARRGVAEGGGGESPQFIESMHRWMTAHAGDGTPQAGKLLYEVQFNLWPDQFQLYPADQTVQPQTAAKYAEVF